VFRTGLVREEKDDHKSIFILISEIDPADFTKE
jgi:hypothetical protein